VLTALSQECDVSRIYLGLTWLRKGSENIKKANQVIKATQEQIINCKIEKMEVSLKDQMAYEAIAVHYAASHNNLPETDMLLGAGGASVRISMNKGDPTTGIDEGFRKGQKKLLKHGPKAISEIENEWKTRCKQFKANNLNKFDIKPKANVIAISVCYHIAKAAGISVNEYVHHAEVMDKLGKHRIRLVSQFNDAKAQSPSPSKKQLESLACDLSSTVMVSRLLFELVDKEASIRFSHDWVVKGSLFRSSWTMGWFIRVVMKLKLNDAPVFTG